MLGAAFLALALSNLTPADTTQYLRVAVAPAETLAVTVRGDGPVVVIIPGLLGGAYGFRHISDRLVDANHRIIVVEPLGTGNSTRPEHVDYSLTAQAARVAAALDTLDVRSALIVVHSVGAAVGYRLAVARPDLVLAILSINGGPAERVDSHGVRTALRFAPILRLFGARGRARGKLEEGLREGATTRRGSRKKSSTPTASRTRPICGRCCAR